MRHMQKFSSPSPVPYKNLGGSTATAELIFTKEGDGVPEIGVNSQEPGGRCV